MNSVTGISSEDLAVIIPTRDRWDILTRTLDALGRQTVTGFEVTVVVDGDDQAVPPLPAARILTKRHGGPGAARNHGAASSRRPVLLFLGDDMIPTPDLVERHLAVHGQHPEREAAVLGHVAWHPDVRRTSSIDWIDRTSTQFHYTALRDRAGEDVGPGYFYSCNVSLKRELFDASGGFDPTFVYYYEDLDLGARLWELGMRLLYEPRAQVLHLHSYDWTSVRRRFEGIALGERLMAAKHPWFEPWFRRRLADAAVTAKPIPLVLADAVPRRFASLREAAHKAADRRVDCVLHADFERAWERAGGVVELREYLGDAYDPQLLLHHVSELEKEADGVGSELEFYRTSRVYLYDLTVFGLWRTKEPYLTEVCRRLPRGARILDYGCGIGTDGLRLMDCGYHVSFADFNNPSVDFLRWRLQRRGIAADIYDLEHDHIPQGFDAVVCFDVIEHVAEPIALLERLEALAATVVVNLLEPAEGDTHLHRVLPIDRIRTRAANRELIAYRVFHGRSHLLIYQGIQSERRTAVGSRAALLRGRAEAWLQYKVGHRIAAALPNRVRQLASYPLWAR